MKRLSHVVIGTLLSSVVFISCQQNHKEAIFQSGSSGMATESSQPGSILGAKAAPSPAACNPNAYTIKLESRTFVNGQWEWIWSVQNSNPGNGNNGTVQDLSHWGMQFGTCVNPSSVTGAAYSQDKQTWTSFTPTYKSDPSQSCMTVPVMKFDFGTTGGAISYYRLTVNQDYAVGEVPGYYKSGSSTGCCVFNVTGISGCGGPEEVVE